MANNFFDKFHQTKLNNISEANENNNFYVLGIESSANKIGVGILKVLLNENTKKENKDSIEILSNVRATYTPPPGQGVIPVDAAEHHRENIFKLLEKALKESCIKMENINLFTYTKGPGMGQLLNVGCTVARTLACYYKKPLVPVNHCVAHIEMGRFVTGAINPVVLYASGGNTQIINRNKSQNGSDKYKIFGETLDVAVGNCFDKIARALNLDNYPSPGLSIERKARESKLYIKLPYSMKGMDMSFSGILSTILKLIEEEKEKIYFKETNKLKEEFICSICYSLQETVFSILCEATERCLSYVGSEEVLIVGGVGCNLRLQEMITNLMSQRKGKVHAMDERYCIDNGAMIAYTGYIQWLTQKEQDFYNLSDCTFTQRFRTDSVKITWE
ncbi:KAE1 [Ecytonucleospora hepatopenaei]|uniref:N(6)-L-threonylcarbamoyladenine synthase n=1 Tax=Ecytonucleospora hepatopenaei TaxID=646526 RepID=A0A1W0E6B4_9MICR|nr:KAE1 [Ecytonucleospora hepatopenaei]